MVETRRTAKTNSITRKRTNYQIDYFGLFLFLGAFFFMIYANQYRVLEQPIIIEDVLEPKPKSEPQLDYKYLEIFEIRARPNPPAAEIIELRIPEPIKNELIVLTVEPRQLHSTLANIIFKTDVPIYKQILETNCNKFLFRLILLEDTYGNRNQLYSHWVDSLRNVFNGNVLFRIQEYYTTWRGTYRLFDSYAYFGNNTNGGLVDISIYRNQTWVDYTSVYVF